METQPLSESTATGPQPLQGSESAAPRPPPTIESTENQGSDRDYAHTNGTAPFWHEVSTWNFDSVPRPPPNSPEEQEDFFTTPAASQDLDSVPRQPPNTPQDEERLASPVSPNRLFASLNNITLTGSPRNNQNSASPDHTNCVNGIRSNAPSQILPDSDVVQNTNTTRNGSSVFALGENVNRPTSASSASDPQAQGNTTQAGPPSTRSITPLLQRDYTPPYANNGVSPSESPELPAEAPRANPSQVRSTARATFHDIEPLALPGPALPQNTNDTDTNTDPQTNEPVNPHSDHREATEHDVLMLTIERLMKERAPGMQPLLTEADFNETRRLHGIRLVNDDLVRVDAPRRANPLFPRQEAADDRPLRRVARSGSLRSVALSQAASEANEDAGGAPAQEEEEEEEEEEEDGCVNLDEVDAPVAEQIRTGLAHLSGVRVEVDVLDGDLPVGAARGNPAAIRARAGLVTGEGEILGAVGQLWRTLVEAREVAGDAEAGSRRLQGEARRLAAELIELRLEAAVARERALSNAVSLEEANLEIAALRARLRDQDR